MSERNLIDGRHVSYSERLDQWKKVRDVCEGEDRVKENGTEYLPQPGAMELKEYNAYKARASFYPVLDRSLIGLLGLIFRNEPVIELPSLLEPLRDSLTNEGESIRDLIHEALWECLSVGRMGLLIDYPTETDSSLALPYVAKYDAEDIVDWEFELRGRREVLTMVQLREAVETRDSEKQERHRILRLDENGTYTVEIWTGVPGSGTPAILESEPTQPTIGTETLSAIPFFFLNSRDTKPRVSKPPSLDLANVNLAHYRNSADYEHALYLCAQPTPWVSGNLAENEKPSSIGSGTLWTLPENGRAGMLEFTGAGVGAQRIAMQDKEDRMAALAARMISESRQRNETAETARLRGRSEVSLLTSSVRVVEGTLTRILRRIAEWVKADPDEVRVSINRDWIETRLSPQEIDAIVRAWQSGAISGETRHYNLQRGEVVPVDRTYEEEQALIEGEEMPGSEFPA